MRLRFYLKIDHVKGHAYGRLVRSVREGSRTRKITLVQLGPLTSEQIPRVKAWLATDPTLPAEPHTLLSDLNQLHVRETRRYGREALGHFLWRKLGLQQIVLETLAGIPGKGRVARWIETMVLNRLAEPTSKYGLLRWLDLSATPWLLDFGRSALHENLFYRAMDRLASRQDALERRIYQRVVRPLTSEPAILYHDLTSSYYEGRGERLVRFGYNRDRVEGVPQVNWGMVVTPEGLPITLQVYPGNTTDVTTVVGMRERLERNFGVRTGIYVGDRGMISEGTEKDLTAHGFGWILAEKSDEVEEVLEAAARLPMVAVSERNEVREVIDKEGRRHVVLVNLERRREILEVLELRLKEGRAIHERVRKNWAKRPNRTPHEVLRQAWRELSEKGLSDLFEVDVDDTTIQGLLARTKDKVRRQKRWAGWWVLTTSTDLPAEEVAARYLGLAVIEHGWRELKSVLEVRPLHHQLDRRIRAHLVICVLAYLVEKYLELKVRAAGLSADGRAMTGARALEEFEKVAITVAELATTQVSRLIVTDLRPEHRAILRAVKIDPEVFQEGWRRLD